MLLHSPCLVLAPVFRSGSGRMTYRELRRSDLLEALFALEREEDINRVSRYFSYEHFYVVYCKFWELDSDHDFSLDKNDLARYNNCALTYQIVERIFEEVRDADDSSCMVAGIEPAGSRCNRRHHAACCAAAAADESAVCT